MGCVYSKRVAAPAKASRSCSSATTPDCIGYSQNRHLISHTSNSIGVRFNNLDSRSGEEDALLDLDHKHRENGDLDWAGLMFSSASSLKHAVNAFSLKRVGSKNVEDKHLLDGKNHGDSTCIETINTWELMEGLEDLGGTYTLSPLHKKSDGKTKLTISEKSITFKTLVELDPSMGTDMDSPVWRKYYIQESDSSVSQRLRGPSQSAPNVSLCLFEEPSLLRAISTSSSWIDVDAISISSIEPLDGGNTPGLKLLVSPANSSPCYASPITTNYPQCHFSTVSFDGADTDYTFTWFTATSPLKSPHNFSRQASITSNGSLKGSSSPLFDSSLMAKFEQALETTVQRDDWSQITEDVRTSITSTSCTNATSSSPSNAVSETDFVAQWQQTEKRLSSSRILLVDRDMQVAEEPFLLGRFDAKCPPKGEQKVVLYFTSLRGIRKTYEECCSVRLILRGLGIQVDERDVSMHAKFKEELREMFIAEDMDGDHNVDDHGCRASLIMPWVPQLFIKGRHIGSADDVKQLHEDGVLAKLVKGIPERAEFYTCEACGDVRFVPCSCCNGSCKVLVYVEDDSTLAMQYTQHCVLQRCPECNENGLILCSVCSGP